MKKEERNIKEENIRNSLIELRGTDIEEISKFISGRLNYGIVRGYGIRIGKVNQKEHREIMRYKGKKRRDFKLKSFKRKGNLRVIYLYI